MKLVIFDFDGVISDSAGVHRKAYGKTFRFFGKKFPVKTDADFRKWYDSHWENNYLRSGFSEKEMEKAKVKYWTFIDYSKAKAFAGIRGVLRELRKKGFKLAIVSTTRSEFVTKSLRGSGLEKLFNLILFANKSEKKKAIAVVLKKFGVKKRNAVMVGDTPADVEGAKGNGIKSIAVSYGWNPLFKLKEAKPDAIARKPGEILKAILKA
jgi:HAD superfamily hydrolase (TIGR01549 family)